MQRFQSRHVIEAVQWKGDNEEEIREFSDFIAIKRGNSPIVFTPKLSDRLGIVVNDVQLLSPNGTMHKVNRGHWIFLDNDNFVRVKEDIAFRILFEHVPEPIPDPEPKIVIWDDDDQEPRPHLQGRLHQARPGTPFQNSNEILSYLLTMKKGDPFADCPTCGKEWQVPRAWKSWKSAKNHNKKGKKASVICVNCNEREVIAKHQRYEDIPDREDLKDEIKDSISVGIERESCNTSKRKHRER
jgi:hypothetical protein